jgi:hypothetical protein
MGDEAREPSPKRPIVGLVLTVAIVVALSCGFAAFLWFADRNEIAAEILATFNVIALIWAVIQLLYSGFIHFRNRA